MLASSGTLNKDSPIVQGNKTLRAYHSHIMSSLSKLVLAAKVASGLWPPPDAVSKLRYQAGQVLLAIRHFVGVAQDSQLELHAVGSTYRASRMASGDDFFDIRGAELSDLELVSRVDTYSDSIVSGIAKLVGLIKHHQQQHNSNGGGGRAVPGTATTAIIDATRATVTEIGQLMSLIEEIRLPPPLPSSSSSGGNGADDDIVTTFTNRKQTLYTLVNDLVTSARTAMDEFAPPNALSSVMDSATRVLQGVEDVVFGVKLVVDERELGELRRMVEGNDSGGGAAGAGGELLGLLQRRAMSLTFDYGQQQQQQQQPQPPVYGRSISSPSLNSGLTSPNADPSIRSAPGPSSGRRSESGRRPSIESRMTFGSGDIPSP
ncbi:hypothetical protein HK104_007500, partial [Borealophlyctis nickersoniae]